MRRCSEWTWQQCESTLRLLGTPLHYCDVSLVWTCNHKQIYNSVTESLVVSNKSYHAHHIGLFSWPWILRYGTSWVILKMNTCSLETLVPMWHLKVSHIKKLWSSCVTREVGNVKITRQTTSLTSTPVHGLKFSDKFGSLEIRKTVKKNAALNEYRL
jgi:hypothetical protein